MEVYNDADGRLVNLFRVVKYHPKALQEELEFVLNSREVFQSCCQASPPWERDDRDQIRPSQHLQILQYTYQRDLGTF